MPVLSARRQAEPPSNQWFQLAPVTAMVEAVQREAIPELIRVFGHDGVYLRASDAVGELLSGNMLANVLSLHRAAGNFAGALHCADDALPLLGSSQSLVCASFVLETAPDSAALLAEFARVLKPDGVLLLLTLNPWCPLRLQWWRHGVRARSALHWQQQVQSVGLEIERSRPLGPMWPGSQIDVLAPEARRGWRAGFAVARLTVARRRDPGITPLRWTQPIVGYGSSVGAS